MDKFEGHPLEITYRGITVPPVYHKYLDNLSFEDFKRGVDAALAKQLRVAKYIPSKHEGTEKESFRREREDGTWLSCSNPIVFSKNAAEKLIKLGIWEIIDYRREMQ